MTGEPLKKGRQQDKEDQRTEKKSPVKPPPPLAAIRNQDPTHIAQWDFHSLENVRSSRLNRKKASQSEGERHWEGIEDKEFIKAGQKTRTKQRDY